MREIMLYVYCSVHVVCKCLTLSTVFILSTQTHSSLWLTKPTHRSVCSSSSSSSSSRCCRRRPRRRCGGSCGKSYCRTLNFGHP